jgi:hypothetical protein
MPVILAILEAEIVRIQVQELPRQTVHKTPSPKWTGGVAQAVQRLYCKCEAPSSDSSLTKKTNKEEKNPMICPLGHE